MRLHLVFLQISQILGKSVKTLYQFTFTRVPAEVPLFWKGVIFQLLFKYCQIKTLRSSQKFKLLRISTAKKLCALLSFSGRKSGYFYFQTTSFFTIFCFYFFALVSHFIGNKYMSWINPFLSIIAATTIKVTNFWGLIWYIY